ncbi:hypothetical protein GUJ93_ZPchr0002g25720 [Zizania palustris]|uniref:Uncharacterized protein n=1 Tax=Zizania palustris TaxID=103762 RepID=A0A8J5RGX3_ZIZPA|nr:hypothetical protein GUJ93_ZPchr0002g25720 [Zizania palustris]
MEATTTTTTAAAAAFISPELRGALAKVAVFVLVQGLVYLILRTSSSVFSKDSKLIRSMSFRPMRSMSVRRVLAPLSDVPVGVGADEPSPSPSPSSSRRWANRRRED